MFETDDYLFMRMNESMSGQKVIKEKDVLEFDRTPRFKKTKITIADKGTFQAVKGLEGRTCALNFAAFKDPCANHYWDN